jgi:hypothetical protein
MSKLPSRIAASGEYRVTSMQDLIGAGFDVTKTGRNPFQYTVELQQPVTNDITDLLNGLFGGAG